MGGKGGPQGVQILLFSMFISIIYSFIYLIHSYFQILLVCEECWVFVGGNILNETCIGHFLWKYCIYNKMKIKLPLLKNYIVLLKKNRTSSVFYARIKTKTVLESLKDFLQIYEIFFHFLFRFLLTRDFRWVTEKFSQPSKILNQ